MGEVLGWNGWGPRELSRVEHVPPAAPLWGSDYMCAQLPKLVEMSTSALCILWDM